MAAAFAIALSVPLALWLGYVLSTMWAWFIVPLGVPTIGVAHAIGICLVAGVARYRHRTDATADTPWREIAEKQVKMSLALLVALGLGWVAKEFM